MGKISFNVDAYTARLIGRENVSKLDGAVLELVKNTYDADATKCILHFNSSENKLYIIDNGSGMTEDIIKDNWMTIGKSTKKTVFKSDKGRIQTGAKGIGRFALDRICKKCIMLTANEQNIVKWEVDWNDFESQKNITEITAEINVLSKCAIKDCLKEIENSELQQLLSKEFKKTGTAFVLTELHETWNDKVIKEIRDSLTSLLPPNIENEFSIYFVVDDQTLEDSKIISNEISSFDYKIIFNSNDTGELNIDILRNEFDFSSDIDQVMLEAKFNKEDKKYFLGQPINIKTSIIDMLPGINENIANSIGAFDGEFYFYKNAITKEDKARFFYKDIGTRTKYSEIFGGIKLYRDNFRIRPYGDFGSSSYDWLMLSSIRNKQPAGLSHPTGLWHAGADQIYGIVNISRLNVNLPDQSNREGIVETVSFRAFRELLVNIIQCFERDRQYVGRKLNELFVFKNQAAEIVKEIEQKSENKNAVPETIDASKAKIAIDDKQQQIVFLEEENRMLRTLATTGIIANTYIHETKTSIHNIGMELVTAKESLEFDNDVESAVESIESARKYKDTMDCWYKITFDSISRDKRKLKNADMKGLIVNLKNLWEKTLFSRQITIAIDAEDVGTFKCFPYEIESIVNNLIGNSMYALRSNKVSKKEIKIELKKIQNCLKIIYGDSGLGLIPKYKKNPEIILEAFETDKRDENGDITGTGMGMWIVKKTVDEYNGIINLEKNKKVKEGFFIEIDLFEL